MAEMEVSAALQKLVVHVYRFPLPATKMIKFTKCFEKNIESEETSRTISSMEQARDDLAHELASGTPNYSNAVAGAQRYCPLIAQVLRSLEQAEEVVYLNEPLSFTWATGLGMRPRMDWITNQAVVWDKCMVLAAQALSYADTVYNMLEDNMGSRFTEAGTHLRAAAGIFERLYKDELPRWVGETSRAPRLVEVEPQICEGLALFCLAQAQQMAIGKGLLAAKTPKTLLTRLCLGVVKLMEDCVLVMRKGGTGSAYDKLDSPFLMHVAFQQSLFKALAYRFMAEAEWAKDRYGVGVGYMKEACRHIEERPNVASIGIPTLSGSLRSVLHDVRALQAEMRQLRDSYNKDNCSIYFEPVPSLDMLDPLPSSVMMMKPLVSAEDTSLSRVLSFKSLKAGGGSGGKGEKWGGAAGAKASGEDGTESGGAQKTDEELARELHEKLNSS